MYVLQKGNLAHIHKRMPGETGTFLSLLLLSHQGRQKMQFSLIAEKKEVLS
jgi:hypothetical protein